MFCKVCKLYTDIWKHETCYFCIDKKSNIYNEKDKRINKKN